MVRSRIFTNKFTDLNVSHRFYPVKLALGLNGKHLFPYLAIFYVAMVQVKFLGHVWPQISKMHSESVPLRTMHFRIELLESMFSLRLKKNVCHMCKLKQKKIKSNLYRERCTFFIFKFQFVFAILVRRHRWDLNLEWKIGRHGQIHWAKVYCVFSSKPTFG